MSTRLHLLGETLECDDFIEPGGQEERVPENGNVQWDVGRFAEEQIHSLTQQVFLAGWPKPARLVVFSAVEQLGDVASICLQIGESLANQVTGTVCVVEANRYAPELRDPYGRTAGESVSVELRSGPLRKSSRQISNRLWVVPWQTLLAAERGLSAAWLHDRLGQLRLEFDYAVVHGPPVCCCGEAALLAQLCDGVVLVLQANSTRRVAARKAKETLHAANAHLLGAVLNERTFPVPDAIYRIL
jgi:hypothetical protein